MERNGRSRGRRAEHNAVTWEARSVMTLTAWVFKTVQHNKKGPTYLSKNTKGQGQILSLLLTFHQILARQSSIEYLPGPCVQSREWSHGRGAVRLRSVPQRSCPNVYIASYLTRLRHRAGVLLRR